MQTYSTIISSPIGKLGISVRNEHLVALHFLPQDAVLFRSKDLAVIKIVSELKQYFEDPKITFTGKLKLCGTPFQQQVWSATAQIKSGKTETYGTLAKKLKSAPRAVGQALRRNQIGIIIPCHRIIAANGLGGYSGQNEGIMKNIKIWLLKHEGFC